MANLLVLLEFYRGAPHPVSLEALGQARRLGSALGLTVYALAPLQRGPDTLLGDADAPTNPASPADAPAVDEDITTTCGRYGADKVVLLTGDQLIAENEMRFQAYAGALLSACTQLPPRILLIGDTPAGRDVAPRLAARLGAAYLPRGAAIIDEGQLALCDHRGRHLRIPAESVAAEGMPPLTIPVVVTVPPGRHELADGAQDAEMLLVAGHDVGSDSTPTAMPGFVEDSIVPRPSGERVLAAGAAWTAGPPLCVVDAGAGAPADAGPDTGPPWRVAIGPDAALDRRAHYALVVDAAGQKAAQQALLTGLAQPIAPPPLRSRSGRGPGGGFGELSQITPTAELDSWDGTEETLAHEAETTLKIRAVPQRDTGPVRREAPPVKTEAPAPHAAGAGAPVPFGGDAGMWEGWATPPSVERGGDDGAPQFELEQADTAPVLIVAPADARTHAPKPEAARPGPGRDRRGPEDKP